jgi:hypothetical protein
MSNIIGIRNNNTIVPYVGATKATKWLHFNQSSGAYSLLYVSGNGSSWTTTDCWVKFTADSSGKWTCEFIARGISGTSAKDINLYLNSVIADTTSNFYQACASGSGSADYTSSVVVGYNASTGNQIFCISPQNTTDWRLSGKFLLYTEPTTYTTAANMEGVTAVDVYIPPASATSAGLVSTQAQTFAGVKTFTGNVGIGTASPTEKLHIEMTTVSPGIYVKSSSSFGAIKLEATLDDATKDPSSWLIGADGLITNGGLSFYTVTSSAYRMQISNAGVVTFNAYGAGTLSTSSGGAISASDGRFKTVLSEYVGGIEDVKKLRPVYYKWNADSGFGEDVELGFIAQDVYAVNPIAAPEPDNPNTKWNFFDKSIIAMLTNAIQEQQVIIEEFKTRLEVLETNKTF